MTGSKWLGVGLACAFAVYGGIKGLSANEAVSDLRDLKSKACACETVECGDEVAAELVSWIETNAGLEVSEAQMGQAEDTFMRIARCLDEHGVSEESIVAIEEAIAAAAAEHGE